MKLSTIPDADVGEADTLLQNPKTIPLRRIVAVSAAVSFMLGLMAATAVTSHAVATQQTMFNGVPGCDDNFNTYGKDYDYCGGGDPSDPQQISCIRRRLEELASRARGPVGRRDGLRREGQVPVLGARRASSAPRPRRYPPRR